MLHAPLPEPRRMPAITKPAINNIVVLTGAGISAESGL